MKARIKATGEIVKLAEYAKITLDMCDSYGNPIELKPEDVELISDVKEDSFSMIDWNQVRVQASIAAMQGLCSNSHPQMVNTDFKTIAGWAVVVGNNLIEELKKEQ